MEEQQKAINSLDAFGYDEGAQYVYGCTYPEWKKYHQKKATEEQMEKYNGSKHLHAKHDKELLATRSSTAPFAQGSQPAQPPNVQICVKTSTPQNSLLSDVCCQDVDNVITPTTEATHAATTSKSTARPPTGEIVLRVGILTVSDRAASNAYETGDLSGPAVESTLNTQIEQMNADRGITISHTEKQIVADEIPDIKQVLLTWSGKVEGTDEAYDLIFTTGGTGFAKRDVTPEATLAVLDRECQGLMSWASMELTTKQPLATLSRAAAGICGKTLIVNLPGNPNGAAQVVEMLLPLLLHAVKDLNGSCR